MIRILFVDDEINVLKGLRRLLFGMKGEWQTDFASSGEEALRKMEESDFDVVVSDLRMPGMDGNHLLSEVQRLHPRAARIILSGHGDPELLLESARSAHQFLTKPCDVDALKGVIGRSLLLREVLAEPKLQEVVSSLTSIPSLPTLYTEILEAASSPTSSMETVGEIISRDVGMTAKVLQLVNSAFFGLPRHVSSPGQAAALLGLETIQALVLSVKVFSELTPAALRGSELESLWRHSNLVGSMARTVCGEEGAPRRVAADAFLAGILHDCGTLVLAANFPDALVRSRRMAHEEGIADWQAERRVLGGDHSAVGAYLLGIWNLPEPVVRGGGYHHSPASAGDEGFSVLTAVHVADALAAELVPSDLPDGVVADQEYLARIGLADRYALWRDACLRLAEDEAAA